MAFRKNGENTQPLSEEIEEISGGKEPFTSPFSIFYQAAAGLGGLAVKAVSGAGALVCRGGAFLWRRVRIMGRWSGRLIKRAMVRLGETLASPFVLAKKGLVLMKLHAGQAKEDGRSPVKAAGTVFCQGVRNNRHIFKTALNYALPVVCIGVLAYVIHFASMLTFAVEVNYNGQPIGYVQNEGVYETAEYMMQQRIIYEDGNELVEAPTQLTVSVVEKDKVINEDRLADQLIKNSDQEISEAEGLYVNGEFCGAVAGTGLIQKTLDGILEEYRVKNPGAEVEFVKDVQVKEGLYLTASIIPMEEMTEKITGNVQTKKTYTVVEGDTPTGVASKNNVYYSDLKALNPDIETNFLVGRQVVLQADEPFLSVKVSKVETYKQTVAYKTEEIKDKAYVKGYSVLKQEGQNGENQITARVEYVNGVEVSRNILETKVLKEPVTKQIIKGDREPASNSYTPSKGASINVSAGTKFAWPVGGGYTSSPYGYRWGSLHTGTDIAAPRGTPVYASAAGTVTLAKWYSGYGKCVIIDHGNGVQTLYGHNSALYVKVGQYVEQGENISAVGMTGQATGNHCHFEVRINGNRVNPEQYIGRRSR